MSDEAAAKSEIAVLVEQIRSVNRRALEEYSPIVEEIVRSRNRNVRHIEQTLDGLLNFCGNSAILFLYRQLCHHYFVIDPIAAASYVQAYREMYDSEGDSGSEVDQ